MKFPKFRSNRQIVETSWRPGKATRRNTVIRLDEATHLNEEVFRKLESRVRDYFGEHSTINQEVAARITGRTLVAFRLSNSSRICFGSCGALHIELWGRRLSIRHLRADWRRYRRARRRVAGKKLNTFTNDIIATRGKPVIGEIPGRES